VPAVAKNAMSSFMFSSLHCHEFYQHVLRWKGHYEAATNIDPADRGKLATSAVDARQRGFTLVWRRRGEGTG